MADKTCKDCGYKLQYQSDLGAPGVGQVWKCGICGESYWVHRDSVVKFNDVEMEDVTMDENCY